MSTALTGGDDPVLNSWILAWDVHALTTNPRQFYDANIFFPFPLPLTYSETLLSGALLVAPVLLLSGNPVLAHNVLTLLALTVAGLGVYLLVRHLTRDWLAAVIGGAIFAFSPFQQDHLIHVQLLQTGWLAFALLFLHRALRSRRLSDFLLFGVFFVCEAWASYYLFFIECVAVATFLVFEALTNRAFWQRRGVARLLGTFVVAAGCIVPPALPYRQTQQTFHFQWDMAIVRDFSARPTDYLALSAGKWFSPELFRRFDHPTFRNEHALFPGFVTLGLASLALVALWRAPRTSGARAGRREICRYLALLVVALGLSFGPYLPVVGRADPVPMPYLALLSVVPGFAAMRVPARFDFLVLLALSVLAGWGVAWLNYALRPRVSAFAWRAAQSALVLALVLDLLPLPRTLTPIAAGAEVAPVYRWLAAQAPGVVAEIPCTPLANFTYEYLSTYHWQPLVNGISGFAPPQFEAIAAQLDAFPERTAVETLRSLGVRYVVAHRAALGERTLRALETADLAALQLHVAASFDADVVYELAPLPTEPPLQDLAHLELPAQIGRGAPAAAVLSLKNDTARPMSVGVPRSLRVEVTTNDAPPYTSEVPMLPDAPFVRPGDETTQAIPVALDSRLLAGPEVEVRVRVTGPVDLETSRRIQFVDFTTSAQKVGLHATVTGVQIPELVHAGTRMHVNFVARNSGTAVWLAAPGSDPGRVGLAARSWTRPDGTPVAVSGSNAAAHLTWNVHPGQEAAFTLVTQAPAGPGDYDLRLDLVSESVTYFDDVAGGALTVIPVRVVD